MHTQSAPETLPGFALLEQTPIILEKLLGEATEEQMSWKPAPERWSISEVLAHLTDVEVKVYRERIHIMVEQDSPELISYDQNAAYAEGRYSGGKPRDNLRQFCHERDRSLAALRYIPATAASRTGRHPELGSVTVGNYMNAWAAHDLGHIRQISELYRARAFYPSMGPVQRFYKLNP